MQGPALISFNQTLGIFIILAQIVALFLFLGFIFYKKIPTYIRNAVHRYGLFAAFAISLCALFGSLFYSEIVDFTPCRYCWFQRITLFPQVILLGIAAWRRDISIWIYSLPLAIIGSIIGVYHYLLQFGIVGGESGGSCGAVGQSVACNSLYVFEHGYITIPLMATTLNILIILIMLYMRKNSSSSS